MKRWLGIDGVDFLIQASITVCVAVVLASANRLNEEIAVFSVFGASLGILAWRRVRAARRGELGRNTPVPGADTAELEQRVAELESMQQRMYELEERVDFAERLLSQQRSPERLPEVR